MLNWKLTLEKIFYLLNIIAFVTFYIKINIQIIDMLYLVFVLFFIIKYAYFEIVR